MKSLINCFLSILMTSCFFSQDLNLDTLKKVEFSNPLDIPLILAGNFGELRPNHFHTGLDFKTKGREGFEITNVANGYVSRIGVSETGYGLALYVDHDNGYTTVYAHLKDLSPDIKTWLERKQYREKRVYGNFYPNKNELVFQKGDLIAISGNSGSSTAPHLHFEIRDTKTEKAVNPLLFNFPITDQIPPSLYGVKFYPIAKNGSINGRSAARKYGLKGFKGDYSLNSSYPIKIKGPFSLAIHGVDRLDSAQNKCGLYKIDLFIDDSLRFTQVINGVNFDVSRYINSYKDYKEYKGGRHYHRNHLLTNNKLDFYNQNFENGVFDLKEGVHDIKYEVYDAHGNLSSAKFKIEYIKLEKVDFKSFPYSCLENNYFRQGKFTLAIPKNTFYTDYSMEIVEKSKLESSISPIYYIKTNQQAQQNKIQLIYKTDSLPNSIKNKVYFATYWNGQYGTIGGKISNDSLIAETKRLAQFTVLVDTLKPKITVNNIYNNKKVSRQSTIRFSVYDKGIGIEKYWAEIDGEWVPVLWKRKSGYYYYKIDKSRVPAGKHTFTIIAIDYLGHKNSKSYDLIF